MKFNKPYNKEIFENFLQSKLFGDKYLKDYKQVPIFRQTKFFDDKNCFILGKANLDKEVLVIEMKQKSKNDPRITLTKDAFKIMQDLGVSNALIVFYSDDSKSYRLSLLTLKVFFDEKEESNPKRYSFLLGEGEKTKTPEKYLNKTISNFEELKEAFNVEVVRKEFFNHYLDLYIKLYKEIQKDDGLFQVLKKENIDIVTFTKNLLGKIVFLYFIQKKGWLGVEKQGKWGNGNKNFMRWLWENRDKVTFEKTGNFYNDCLEHLFYDGLNSPSRIDNFDYDLNFKCKIPYLNGGLFKSDYDFEKFESQISNDIFSNSDETGILDVFDRYNFTIDEDDLYDSEMAVDPEMLGRIFEKMISISSENIDTIIEEYDKGILNGKKKKITIDNLLNKKLGAFYTPREIVHYMTKESLISYLVNNLKGKKEENEQKVRKLFNLKEEFLITKLEITEEVFDNLAGIIEEIDDLLKKVKILDPAIGSGAFPMGLLHEISSIRYYIYGVFFHPFNIDFSDFKNTNGKVSLYKIKRNVIQNNIYGVDISSGAIDIARLRFWLSLVVDEESPEPLPNFEFKFVCANTLIPLSDEKGLYDNIDEEKLRVLMRKYYNLEFRKEKEEVKQKITNMLSQNNIFASEKEKQLLSYRPFDTTNSAEFFDSSLMMGLKRGERFDIVIGNPPYVRHEEIKELKPILQKTFKTYSGTADLYCYFYEKGFDLLKQGGFLSYITSNKFLKAKYGEKIRNLFKNETIIRDVIDFGGYKVFDNATVDSIIFQFEKGFKVSNSFGVLDFSNKVKEINQPILEMQRSIEQITKPIIELQKNLKKSFDTLNFKVNQEKLSNNSWTLSNNKILEIKEKIEKQGIKLKDYCGEPKVGIKTGLNKVLIVNQNLKNKIIGNNLFENKIFKEVIFGKNITKYYTKFDNLFLIFPYIFDDNIGELKTINLDDFPNTKSYLLNFYDDLKNRATFNNGKKEWFELQQINKNINFDIGYIVFPDIGQKPSFSYKKGYSVDMTGFIIDKDDKFLVGLLNSKLIYFYFTLIASKLGNKGYRFKNQFINQLPIKQISPESQKPFIEKVDKILEITKQDFYDPKNPPKEQKDLEDEIDKMVYELYGLSEEEVRVVEESLV